MRTSRRAISMPLISTRVPENFSSRYSRETVVARNRPAKQGYRSRPFVFSSVWPACQHSSGPLSVWLRSYSGAVGHGGSSRPGSISPSSGCRRNEHFLRAEQLYAVRDYDGALAEVEIVQPKLPNNADLFSTKASIERQRGHWEKCTQSSSEQSSSIRAHTRFFIRLGIVMRVYGAMPNKNRCWIAQ